MLLDNVYNLKIADFGFAAPIHGRDGSGNLTTKLGTVNYMAPEIHLNQPYQGKTSDIFAAGIILFIMVAQHPPFTTAQPQDPFYRCLAANRADIFWRTHCKNKPNGFFSQSFRELVESMLQLDPSHRPTIGEVLQHPWMQEPLPSHEEVINYFKVRDIEVRKAIEAEREQKELEKQKRISQKFLKVNRSSQIVANETGEKQLKPSKAMQKYEKLILTNTEFFSTYNPDMIEEALIENLHQERVIPKVSKDQYKIKFTMVTKDQGGQTLDTQICVRILQVDDNTVCVEFMKIGGDKIRFNEHFQDFKNHVLNCMNDTIGQTDAIVSDPVF